MKINELTSKDYEIRNYHKLDRILSDLCEMVIKGQRSDKDYGMVAACVLDTDNNIVSRLNRPGKDGKRIHAEHAAINAYKKQYGDIPEGSIILSTLSPCNHHMDERDGPACADLIKENGVLKVYCGYMDPTMDKGEKDHRHYNLMETENKKIRKLCQKFADTFLDKINEWTDVNNPSNNDDRYQQHGDDPITPEQAQDFLDKMDNWNWEWDQDYDPFSTFEEKLVRYDWESGYNSYNTLEKIFDKIDFSRHKDRPTSYPGEDEIRSFKQALYNIIDGYISVDTD